MKMVIPPSSKRVAVVWSAAAVLLTSSAARGGEPPELAGFPVHLGRANRVESLTAADLGSGPVLIVRAKDKVVVIGADGHAPPGVTLGAPTDQAPLSFSAPPAACDLDGDGRREIVAGGSGKRLVAVTSEGAVVPGFPVELDGTPRGAPSCLPVAGSRRQDVVLTTDAGSLVVVSGKGGKPRRLGRIGRGAESGVAVADVDGDGALDVIAGGGDARLYAFTRDGKALRGFPYKMSFRSSGIPSVGDIDDDGRPEVVAASQDFKIHALETDGRPLAGFPVATGYRLYAGVSLADLDGDGVLDVLVGSGDGSLYALDGKGRAIAGFPVKLDGRIELDAAVGDVDRDGEPEILVVAAGSLLLVERGGRKRRLEVSGTVTAGPVLADLDGDGLPEVVAGTKTGDVHALKLEAGGAAERALVAWPQAGHDAGHSGWFSPNPGRFKELGFVNREPRTTDALQVRYRFFDLDGDAERDTQIRWFCDGKHVPELDNRREVPAERTRKHQTWRYRLQEGESFHAYGERGVLSRSFESPAVEVRNTAAAAPAVALSPSEPATTAKLVAKVTRKSTDADGDAIEYRFVWLRDGKPVEVSTAQAEIGPRMTRKNERWRVVVVPFDGEVEGATATAAVRVRNTPPGPPAVSVQPARPRIGDEVVIRIDRPAVDDDGDDVTYTYDYRVDGRTLGLPSASGKVAAGVLRKHQKVEVEVTAHDDEEAGGRVKTRFEVANTSPPPPRIAIWPEHPRTTDDLKLAVRAQAPDEDRDPIVLRHRWRVDGAPAEHPEAVPAAATRKGQTWRLEVVPFDGEQEGRPVSVEARVENTPPVPPVLELDRYTYFTDERVAPRIDTPASDADGDAVKLRYRWSRNGKPVRFPASKAALDAADTAKGQTWDLDVVPNDGETDGPVAHLRFAIENSPPSAPRLAVSSAAPTVRDRVTVKIAAPATDKDSDRLVYRYRWFRDGKPVPDWPLDKAELLPGETRKGQRWRVEVRAFDGAVEGAVALAELTVRNHAPAPPRVELTPASPRTTDDLVCARTQPGEDPDGDALTYRTRWLVDGAPAPVSPGLDRLSSALTHKKQRWQCEVTAYDGAVASEPVRSVEVVIRNTRPRRPVVAIAPATATTDQDLVCALERPSVDSDLDLVSYGFAWKVDGKPWRPKRAAAGEPDPRRVPAAATRRGQTWECRVTPADDETQGRQAAARVVIQNSPPTTPVVRVLPDTPRAGKELRCEIVEPSRDPDNDRVQYRFVWLRDGIAQPFAPISTTVPGRLVKAREMWRCEVTPTDGTVDGAPGPSPDTLVGDGTQGVGKDGRRGAR